MKWPFRKLEEHSVYFGFIFLMYLAYLLASWRMPNSWFGFHQLRRLDWTSFSVLLGAAAAIAYLSQTRWWAILTGRDLAGAHKLLRHPYFLVYCALGSAMIFLLLRNGFINADGKGFPWKFRYDIPIRGAHVTHDEILELYVHSRFFYYMNRWMDWSCTFSYQFLSSVAGGAFVLFLLLYVRTVSPEAPFQYLFLILSGGYMQLYFGDVENYTFTNLLILIYFYTSALYLMDRLSLIVPCIVLAIAFCFHLLAGWLLPSLCFLCWMAWLKKQKRVIILGLGAFAAIFAGVLIYFEYHGLPIRNLIFHSHVTGHWGKERMLVLPRLRYYQQLVNLLFLLFPSAWVLIPLVIYRRISATPWNVFLVIATVFLLLFMSLWESKIGVYNDWNLFAVSAFALSLLVWHNFLNIKDLKYKKQIYLALLLLSLVPTSIWILSNHFDFPQEPVYWRCDYSQLRTIPH